MNSKNRKKHILVPLISAILIVIVGMLNIDFYFKSVMFLNDLNIKYYFS